jgi:hypothetical protein
MFASNEFISSGNTTRFSNLIPVLLFYFSDCGGKLESSGDGTT